MNRKVPMISPSTGPEPWRLQVLNQGSMFLAVIMVPVALIMPDLTVLKEMPIGFVMGAYVSTVAIVIVAVWRSAHYTGRVVLLLAGLLSFECIGILLTGFVLGPLMFALMAVVAGGLLMSVRWAFGIWLVSTLIMFACTFLLSTGVITSIFNPALVDPSNLEVGIRLSLAYLGLSPILAIGASSSSSNTARIMLWRAQISRIKTSRRASSASE